MSRLRSALSRIPRAALACAAVAVLNAAAWAILLPPLQAHDEQAHVYYAQYLAETGNVPRPIDVDSRTEEQIALENGVRLFDVVGNTNGRPPWTEAERSELDRTLSDGLSRKSASGGDEAVGTYPPLYYATVAIGYKVASGGTLIERILAMRLVSALLAGVAVMFVFLFLRELFPRDRWLWPIGALVVAFLPVFAFISGAVNPDVGLAAASASVFYLLARGFRRGLTPRLAAAIGLAVALGVLAKITMVAFVPGAALGVLLIAIRAHRAGRGHAARLFGAAVLAFAVPIAVYIALNLTVWDRSLLPGGGGGGVGGGTTGSFSGLLSYAWQDYLPRLPGMTDWFNGYNAWETWFKSFWGVFGWGDYGFSNPTFRLILVASLLVALGVAVASFRSRLALRRRLGELASYALMTLGLLVLLAYVGYGYRVGNRLGFEQGRYLLPLLAPLAAFVVMGISALGPRLGRFAGVLVVVGSIGLTIYAHLLTVARFYA